MKHKLNRIWTVIILLILMQTVHALGVAPSSQEILFEPDAVRDIQIKIVNSEHEEQDVVLYAEGELEDYISLETDQVSFRADQDYTIIRGKLALPPSLDEQGIHETKVVIRQVGTSTGKVTARVSVSSLIRVIVPYEGAYLTGKLFVPDVQQGATNNFVVQVSNLGTEDALDARVIIDILGPLGDSIDTISSDPQRVKSKDTYLFSVPWIATLEPGEYQARASVVYDERSVTDEKSFRIGDPKVVVKLVQVQDFRLGGIAKIDIFAESRWNKPIDDLYGTAEVRQNGKKVAESTTETVSIDPYAIQELNAYWDTANNPAGGYDLVTKLFYLNTYTEEKTELVVTEDSIKTGAVGRVTDAQEGENKLLRAVYIVIGLVVLLIIINAYILMKRRKKH